MPSKDKPTSIDLLLKINKTPLPTSHLTLSSANTHTNLFCARHRGWSEGRSAAPRTAYAFRAMCIIMSRSLVANRGWGKNSNSPRTNGSKQIDERKPMPTLFCYTPTTYSPTTTRAQTSGQQSSHCLASGCLSVWLSVFLPPWVLYSFWFIHSITHVLGYLLTSLVFKNVKSDWVQIDALRNGSADMITSWKISKHWVSHRLWQNFSC